MTSNVNPCRFLAAPQSGPQASEPQSRTTLILAAHPDDEVIGATSVLTSVGGAAYVVFLTDGAPLDAALWSSHQQLPRSDYATLRWLDQCCPSLSVHRATRVAGSAAALRPHFQRIVRTSPTAYRRCFHEEP